MIAPEIAFGISLLFGLQVLIYFLLAKPTPILSLLLHLFGFLVGFILLTTSGETWQNTVLSLSTIAFILSFLGGFYFLLNDAVAFKPPSKILGLGYMTFLTVGFVLLIIR